jgi:hypothetical protein
LERCAVTNAPKCNSPIHVAAGLTEPIGLWGGESIERRKGTARHPSAAPPKGTYIDAEADPEEVVADLEGMLQRLGGLGEALGTYNQV